MEFGQLTAVWGPRWRIWRGRNSSDAPGERTGDLMASRIDDTAGLDPTVTAATVDGLDRELRHQARMAHAFAWLVGVLCDRGMRATPVGSRIVQVVHPETARRDTVVLGYSEQRDSLTWQWLREYDYEPIGPADDPDLVAGRIIDAIGRPAPAAPRAGHRHRL